MKRISPVLLVSALILTLWGCSSNKGQRSATATSAVTLPSMPTVPPVPSLIGDYNMDVVCDTNAQLRIKKVTVNDKNTIIAMTFSNETIGDEVAVAGAEIRTSAPGEYSAFYIADPESRMEYKLLNVEGLPISPTHTELQEGQSVDFTLTFERIPDTMTKFHVIEGKQQTVDKDGKPTINWKFMNVKLKE